MSNFENRLFHLEDVVAGFNSRLINDFSHVSRSLQSNETVASLPTINSGDTAWMLFAVALVLLMTCPGLALYYSGMVEKKNVLATAMQSLSITCLITVLWLMFGYSLSFAPTDKIRVYSTKISVIGDASRMWLLGVDYYSVHALLASTIPESVFVTFQATFAIITPALIVGSFTDRVKFGALMIFVALWHIFVYCPVAHANWHPEGFLFRLGSLDYAGGNVVHISSGVAGLVTAIVIGKRKQFGKIEYEPSNLIMTFMGASMLWFGWFGFNAGSAAGASPRAGMAMITTMISTGVAAFTWMLTEWYIRGKPGVGGMLSGAVAGLVAITPACGYVDTTAAFVIGFVAGPWCFFGARVKNYLGYDDALDAFGVHATGGILGGILTGCFARHEICGINGAFYGYNNGKQVAYQLAAIGFSIAWSAGITFCILMLITHTIGLRVSESAESLGLDSSIHGENMGEFMEDYISYKSKVPVQLDYNASGLVNKTSPRAKSSQIEPTGII